MDFTVYRVFANDDENFWGDALFISLVRSDNPNEEIMRGDYYHDKIDEMIDGFFACLEYLEIPNNRIEVKLSEECYKI